jgi:hypothetical protein
LQLTRARPYSSNPYNTPTERLHYCRANILELRQRTADLSGEIIEDSDEEGHQVLSTVGHALPSGLVEADECSDGTVTSAASLMHEGMTMSAHDAALLSHHTALLQQHLAAHQHLDPTSLLLLASSQK